MTEAAPVVLYGTTDCHLCEQAEAMLVRIAADLQVTYRKVDIQSSPQLFERYRYRIPVIEVAGGETLEWPTTPERIRRAIRGAASAR